MQIFKYILSMDDEQKVQLPMHSNILFVGAKDGKLCVWAQVPYPDAVKKPVRVFIYGTGHEIKRVEEKKYLGSVVMEPFVWHVFVEEAPLG
jgi:hypothetical protein